MNKEPEYIKEGETGIIKRVLIWKGSFAVFRYEHGFPIGAHADMENYSPATEQEFIEQHKPKNHIPCPTY